MPTTAAYTMTVNGSPEKNQLRNATRNPPLVGRSQRLTSAHTADAASVMSRNDTTCASTFRARTGRTSGARIATRATTGAHSAHVYHPGASVTNARQSSIGWPDNRAKVTVSNVERSAGTVHAAITSIGERTELTSSRWSR